jgi:hypothetical protein
MGGPLNKVTFFGLGCFVAPANLPVRFLWLTSRLALPDSQAS